MNRDITHVYFPSHFKTSLSTVLLLSIEKSTENLVNQSVVASAMYFALVYSGSNIRAGDTNRLNKLIKKAGSVIGCKLDSFEVVVERMLVLVQCPPLHHLVDRQRSTFSSRLVQLRCRKDRYRKSFLPIAISLQLLTSVYLREFKMKNKLILIHPMLNITVLNSTISMDLLMLSDYLITSNRSRGKAQVSGLRHSSSNLI